MAATPEDKEPNHQFIAARKRLESKRDPGTTMTQEEFAEECNKWLQGKENPDGPITGSTISKIEQGYTTWPRVWRRKAYRAITGETTDAELGLHNKRRTRPLESASIRVGDGSGSGGHLPELVPMNLGNPTPAGSEVVRSGHASSRPVSAERTIFAPAASIASPSAAAAGVAFEHGQVEDILGLFGGGGEVEEGSEVRRRTFLAGRLVPVASGGRQLGARQRREAADAAARMGVAASSLLQGAPYQRCGTNGALDAVRDGLHTALVSYRPVRHAATAGRSVRELWAGTASIHAAYQRGDYTSAARSLPAILDDAQRLADATSGRHRERALRVVAAGYLAASKLASKAGDGTLAWLAADRAGTAANLAGALALSALSTYQAACALLRLPGTVAQAEALAVAAADDLGQPTREPDADLLSARGALLLLAAVTAGRRGDHADVRSRLDAAATAARQLGRDGNWMWTAFGPSNIAIHQLSIAVAMRQPDAAVRLGEQLDVRALHAGLGGRRAQVHLDLAAANAQYRDRDAVAVLHLLEAERVAPQAVYVNIGARDLLTVLLNRERRSATPGLRPLAQRAAAAA